MTSFSSVARRLRLAPRTTPAVLWTAALGLLAVGLVGTWFTSPRAMLIEEIHFEGNQRATSAELRHLVDVTNGATHLGVNGETIARNAERHPWVRESWTRRTWHGLVITVDEHRPVALAQVGQAFFYIDERGEPLLLARSDDLDYPVIAGLDASVRSLHPELAGLVLRDAVSLLDAADERGLLSADAVSEIVFSRSRGFTVHMRDGSEVLFGLDGHERQLERLSSLVASDVLSDGPAHIDLAPERVAIVRPISLSPSSQGEG